LGQVEGHLVALPQMQSNFFGQVFMLSNEITGMVGHQLERNS